MTRQFQGSLSGVYFDIPELDDPADIEAAFANFADTIPASPVVMTTKTVTADVNPAEPNTLYVFEGSAPHTVFLAPGQNDADKISILQLQNDPITVNPNGVNFQGPTATSTQFSALTIMWQAAEGRWVGSPFFSSGVLPPASIGGEIVDLLGRRYHVFRNPGQEFFYAHKDMTVDVLLVGPGGDGAPQGALAGDGGRGGQVVTGQAHVDLMQSFPVAVGANGFPSVFRSLTAAPGADGVVDTVTPVDAPYSLPADLAQVLGYTTVGGSGQADSGPAGPSTYGKGGSGAFKTIAPVARPSHVVNHPGSPGGSYWVETKPAWSETVKTKDPWTQMGDPCVSGQCPPGWRCGVSGQIAMGVTYNCFYDHPAQYTTVHHPAEGYYATSPGSPGWSETVWDPCPSGYKVGSDTTTCVDARGVGPGQGGDGVVVISYPTP
jgi:hypothetical protein